MPTNRVVVTFSFSIRGLKFQGSLDFSPTGLEFLSNGVGISYQVGYTKSMRREDLTPSQMEE